MSPLPTAVATLLLVTLSFSSSAQESPDDDSAGIGRDEWRARVKASHERANAARREQKVFIPQMPTSEELAEEASKRVLKDDSLKRGDIVSTNHGLFRFRGDSDKGRMPEDFERVR